MLQKIINFIKNLFKNQPIRTVKYIPNDKMEITSRAFTNANTTYFVKRMLSQSLENSPDCKKELIVYQGFGGTELNTMYGYLGEPSDGSSVSLTKYIEIDEIKKDKSIKVDYIRLIGV